MTFFTSLSVHAEMLSIKGDKVNLRKGPGKKYSVIWKYGAGFPVEIVDRKGNWLKVNPSFAVRAQHLVYLTDFT
jgi:SH3-like domain-containing protein